MDIVKGHLRKLVTNNNFFCDKEFSNDHPDWIGIASQSAYSNPTVSV